MSDSDWEEQADRCWPDADARAARRTELMSTLKTFLAEESFVESDGGWAAAEDEHVADLCAIIQEIVDLKFERDPDGDSVINYNVVNRRQGRLFSVIIPYSPDNIRDAKPTLVDRNEYLRSLVRNSGSLISALQGTMIEIEQAQRDQFAALAAQDKLDELIDNTSSLIHSDVDAAAETLYQMERDYPDNPRLVRLRQRLDDVLADERQETIQFIENALNNDGDAGLKAATRKLQWAKARYSRGSLEGVMKLRLEKIAEAKRPTAQP